MLTSKAASPIRSGHRAYRWIRQLHIWIGAWGALAAIAYGFTGLVMNHRFGEGAWPQGESEETGKQELVVPANARTTPEQLSLWLRETHRLDAQVIRKGPPAGSREGGPPPKWSLSGGTAREAWVLEYSPGKEFAELKRSAHSPLAALNRLHKGVGGGWAWTLLADSFAVGMLLLGLSGLWMWVRGRRPRDMLLSVLGLSTLVLALVLGPALA